MEHLIFRMGNQLFLVHVIPNSLGRAIYDETTFLSHAELAHAIPCLMPMMEKNDGTYIPVHDGSGLIHAQTLAPIAPTDVVTDDLIEMSNWELEDFAVKLVAEDCQHYPDLWSGIYSTEIGQPNFIMFNRPCGTYYVHVVASKFPDKPVENVEKITNQFLKLYSRMPRMKQGFIAKISLANADVACDGANVFPLYRGCGMIVKNYEWVEI